MKVRHRGGVAAAAEVTGAVVVIDVLRAFTVSAVALAGGATEVLYVADLEAARRLASELDGVLSAEVEGMPVPGVEISNSPSAVAAVDLRGRVLVQRSTSGVQALAALPAGARPVFAGCLAIATATARALEATGVEEVTLVATGEDRGHPEDRACALYLEGLLQGRPADLDALLAPLYESDRYRVVAAGDWPGFPPADLTLALAPDRFDFAIPIGRDAAGRLRATRS